MGIPVEYVHHEVAPSQHEIDLRYTDALTMADNVMTYRLTVKEVAQEFGDLRHVHAQARAGVNGSGMHTHQSLFEGDRNAFFDASDEYHLSTIGEALHRRASCSTRREITLRHEPVGELVQAAGPRLRGAGLRVLGPPEPLGARPRAAVQAGQGGGDADRVPLARPRVQPVPRVRGDARAPASPASRASYELPPEASNNIYEMTEDERERRRDPLAARGPARGDRRSPSGSKVLREALGDHVLEFLIRNKREEWDAYKSYVTPVRAGAVPPDPVGTASSPRPFALLMH